MDKRDPVAVTGEFSDGTGAALQKFWILKRGAAELDNEFHGSTFRTGISKAKANAEDAEEKRARGATYSCA
jgi:hypothetical protein